MKRILTYWVLAMTLGACNGQTTTTQIKIDSLGEKVDEAAGKALDSTKAGARKLEEKIEQKIESIKDSVRIHKDSIKRKNY